MYPKGKKVKVKMSGFISLHRKMLEWEWYKDANVVRVFLHCLLKANWKDGHFQGRLITRGSFATSYATMSEILGLSVKQIRTALNKLEKTKEVGRLRDGNFLIITITKYVLYQDQGQTKGTERADQGQTKGTERATIEKGNKEIKKEFKTPPYPPEGELGECDFLASSVYEKNRPKKTDSPSKGHTQWAAFLSCWEIYPVKQGQEDAWREWMRLHDNGTLAQCWEIRDSILRHQAEDRRWQRGMIPSFANWLKGKRWNDEPYIDPSEQAQSNVSPEEQKELDKLFYPRKPEIRLVK